MGFSRVVVASKAKRMSCFKPAVISEAPVYGAMCDLFHILELHVQTHNRYAKANLVFLLTNNPMTRCLLILNSDEMALIAMLFFKIYDA